MPFETDGRIVLGNDAGRAAAHYIVYKPVPIDRCALEWRQTASLRAPDANRASHPLRAAPAVAENCGVQCLSDLINCLIFCKPVDLP